MSKLRDERETAARDIALLRADLDNTRQERERAVAEAARSKEELDKWVRGWGYGSGGAAGVCSQRGGKEVTELARLVLPITAYGPAPPSCRLRDVGGKSLETLEALSNDKATMETQLSMQVSRTKLCPLHPSCAVDTMSVSSVMNCVPHDDQVLVFGCLAVLVPRSKS